MLDVCIYFAESKCKALTVQHLNCNGKKINQIVTDREEITTFVKNYF